MLALSNSLFSPIAGTWFIRTCQTFPSGGTIPSRAAWPRYFRAAAGCGKGALENDPGKTGNLGLRAHAREAGHAPAPAAHARSGATGVVGTRDGRQGKTPPG